MITIPPLGSIGHSVSSNHNGDCSTKNMSRSGSVLELLLGSREHSNRESREGSIGPPSRQSSNASVSSVSSLQDAGNTGSQFFEVLYLGKIKSVSHKKAPPSFIDDALEKIRAHNEMEQQKSRQTSLPIPTKIPITTKSMRQTSIPDEIGEQKWNAVTRLRDAKLEEEVSDSQESSLLVPKPKQSNSDSDLQSLSEVEDENNTPGGDTLDVLKKTEQLLKNLSNRVESQDVLMGRTPSTVTLVPVQTLVSESEAATQNLTSNLSSNNNETMDCFIRERTSSGDTATMLSRNDSLYEPIRSRASSMGSSIRPRKIASVNSLDPHRQTSNNEHNRTMLFQISRCDIKLISPDRKSILLSKSFKDVSHCSQGVKNPDHFGFICRDAASENNVCYVFKCQNNGVVSEIVTILKQAGHLAAEAQKKVQGSICEHCPMIWLQKLTSDIEGLSDQKMHSIILKRLGTLPENEQHELMAKFQGAEVTKIKEQNDLLILLLRAHCETRQLTHVHDTAEHRHEFLSQYLDRGSGAIFQKAKRSLTNSFDQLLKRKTKEETTPDTLPREFSLPIGAAYIPENVEHTPTKQSFRFDVSSGLSQSPLCSSTNPLIDNNDDRLPPSRPRSSTLGSSHGDTIKKELLDIRKKRRSRCQEEEEIIKEKETNQTSSSKTPIMDIFFKMGNPNHLQIPEQQNNTERTPSPRKAGSWRQAIFQQVVTPNQNGPKDFNVDENRKTDSSSERPVRTRENLRELWRKAIKQQILLVHMEKENKKLRAHQEEMTVKRMKLNYDEIVICNKEATHRWDKLLQNSSPDLIVLTQAVERGVPKQRRGEIWQLLINTRSIMETIQPSWLKHLTQDEYSYKRGSIDYERFPHLDVPYEELLRELTSYQHAIIIDLGRTFPTHAYYSTSLGPGQLALYNLLKAYSLLDTEVGYCQGLSFIAGILLLHVDEKGAYYMLRYLMLELGLRYQYLPDMAALQVQLYQMARLLRDLHRDLYEHLEQNEVTPSLYAAPWFLTLFASQFPLGFVVRIFDLIFLCGISMVFRVAISLLADHKDMLLQCRNFEQLMDYFKTTLPSIGSSQLERVVHEALELDITRQLAAYEVEYHVLQEEIVVAGIASPPSSPNPNVEVLQKVDRLEKSNQILHKQIRELQAQLQGAKATIRVLEANLTANQAMYTRLERQLHNCEADRTALMQLVTDLTKRIPRGEEVIIPPCLVKCFEEYKSKGFITMTVGPNLHLRQDEDGISMNTKHPNLTKPFIKLGSTQN